MSNIYLLSNQKHKDTKSLSVIDIKYLKTTITCKNYEAIIFTSKNAVLATEQLDKDWKNLEIYSIGKGTSRAITDLGARVFYESSSAYGDEFAKEIAQKLKNKQVLFPHAKEVVSDVFGILKGLHVRIDEAIVYETICKKHEDIQQPEKNSILIFTSPSTVKCFFKYFIWDSSYKVVAIGKKTAEAFPENLIVHTSLGQTIDECIDFAKRLSKDCI